MEKEDKNYQKQQNLNSNEIETPERYINLQIRESMEKTVSIN